LVAAFSPGAIVVEVARQYEVSTGLIYKWRAEAMVMGTRATGEFVPALIVEDPPDKSEREPAPAIVVELASGVRVTISGSAPAAAITAALRALRSWLPGSSQTRGTPNRSLSRPNLAAEKIIV
jgi:transposase